MAHPAQIGSRIRRHTRVRYVDIKSVTVGFPPGIDRTDLDVIDVNQDGFVLSLPGDEQARMTQIADRIMLIVSQLHH